MGKAVDFEQSCVDEEYNVLGTCSVSIYVFDGDMIDFVTQKRHF